MTGLPADSGEPQLASRRVRLDVDLRDIRRIGLIGIALVCVFLLGRFVLSDGGLVFFTVVMAWMASIAMEPAVSFLTRWTRRGFATGIVMVSVVLAAVGFFVAFGGLLADQIAQLVRSVPDLLDALLGWVNDTFGLNLDTEAVLEQINLGPSQIADIATNLAGGLLGVVASVLGAVFSVFTLGLFTFYLSADAPRLKRWLARLMPPRHQEVFVTVWDIAVQKTGGYVAARVVLAAICGSFTAVFLLVIGMDYWLALGLWTGVVSQFVPTIGTYIAIALPVLVGLVSSQPWDGVLALIFGLVYQQVENLTIEPRISAQAVDMHPAVAFGSVMLGGSLFGVAGALVAVPMSALALALFEIYSKKYALLPQLATRASGEGRTAPEVEPASATRLPAGTPPASVTAESVPAEPGRANRS